MKPWDMADPHREEFLRRLQRVVAGAVKACRDAHGKVDPGSVAKRVAAQLWAELDLVAHPDTGSWLRHLRGTVGVSQAELAAKLGLTQDRVSKWESGKHSPRPETVATIKEAVAEIALERLIQAETEPSLTLEVRLPPSLWEWAMAQGGSACIRRLLEQSAAPLDPEEK